jgi:hypothetical protein
MSAAAEEDRVRSVLQEMLETGATFRPPVGPVELRRRGSRRFVPRPDIKVVVGVAAAVILIVALFAIAPHHKSRPETASATTVKGGTASNSFLVRPALCFAPPFQVQAGANASTGPLPTCSASSQLSAANLQIVPNPGDVSGYTTTTNNIQPDPAFATYPSTPSSNDASADTVLLPGIPGEGPHRYVLGPAQLSGTGVASASAGSSNGQWLVNITLTNAGSIAWDALASQQFHQVIGVDLNGHIISAPIIQPTQSSVSSFHGQIEIGGDFTQAQATTVAQEISHAS